MTIHILYINIIMQFISTIYQEFIVRSKIYVFKLSNFNQRRKDINPPKQNDKNYIIVTP